MGLKIITAEGFGINHGRVRKGDDPPGENEGESEMY